MAMKFSIATVLVVPVLMPLTGGHAQGGGAAPSDEMFISNMTDQDVTVLLHNLDGAKEMLLPASKLKFLSCPAKLDINNNGAISSWYLSCSKRYVLRLTPDRKAFSVAEVSGE
jgi:hypothetical protein